MSSHPAKRDVHNYRSNTTSCVSALAVPLRTRWAVWTAPQIYLPFPDLSYPPFILIFLFLSLSPHHFWKRLLPASLCPAGSLSIIPVLLHVLLSSLFCSVSVPLSTQKHLMMCQVCQTSPRPSPVSPHCPGEPVLSRPCHLWSSLRWQEHVKNKALDGMHGSAREWLNECQRWIEERWEF